MKSSPHGKYTPEQERSAYGKTESAAERKSLRDLARQGKYHGGGSRRNNTDAKRREAEHEVCSDYLHRYDKQSGCR